MREVTRVVDVVDGQWLAVLALGRDRPSAGAHDQWFPGPAMASSSLSRTRQPDQQAA